MKATSEEDVQSANEKETKQGETVTKEVMTGIGENFARDGLQQIQIALKQIANPWQQTLTIYKALGKIPKED